MRGVSWLIFLFAASGLAGCIDAPEPSGSTARPLQTWETTNDGRASTPSIPLLINETEDPDGFWVEVPPETERCRWPDEEGYVHSFLLYDRSGKVYEERVKMNPEAPLFRHWISLSGEAPWVFVGSLAFCADLWEYRVHGVTEGYEVERGTVDVNHHVERIDVEVEVPPGASSASIEWMPDEWIYMLDYATIGPDRDEGIGWGKLSLIDAEGRDVYVRDESLLGDGPRGARSLIKTPGAYQVEVVQDHPSVVPNVWRLTLVVRALDPQFCIFDVEWPLCDEERPPSPS